MQRGREHGLIPDLRVDLNRDASKRVRDFLSHYSPPPGALEAMRAWDRVVA